MHPYRVKLQAFDSLAAPGFGLEGVLMHKAQQLQRKVHKASDMSQLLYTDSVQTKGSCDYDQQRHITPGDDSAQVSSIL